MCALALMRRRVVSTPRDSSIPISSNSASRFTTTPLPITGTTCGERMPAGRSLSSNFSPPTTTVWPAVLPPLGLTTYSTRSPRRSVALPFPSSPRWAPTITTAGMATPGDWTTGGGGPRGSYQGRAGRPLGGGRGAGHPAGTAAAPPRRAPSVQQAGIGLAEEGGHPIGLGLVAESPGGLAQQGERPQEAAVRGVGGRDRSLTPPAGLAQGVPAAVVPGAGVGVGGDLVAVGQRVLGEGGPDQRGVEMTGGDVAGLAVDQLLRHLDVDEVVGQSGLRDAQEVPAGEVIGTISHASIV